VLDAIIAQDKFARVACETLVKTGVAIIAGEVTTSAWVDLEDIVRKVIIDIGYNSSDVGFDGATCGVMNIIGKQSGGHRPGRRPRQAGRPGRRRPGPDVRLRQQRNRRADACTDHLLAPPGRAPGRSAQSGLLPWLRPDAKSQVTCRYEDGKVVGIDAVVLSTQHNPEVSHKDLREGVMELIVKHVLPAELLPRTPSSTSTRPASSSSVARWATAA
jgi:S-adenosylmethionine synthetase